MTSRRQRPRGVTAKAWRELREFEKTQAAWRGRQWPRAQVPVACRCSKWPFAHVHEGEGKWEYEPEWQFLKRLEASESLSLPVPAIVGQAK